MVFVLTKSFLILHFLRTFVGIIDEYFDGYYAEEMIESQVHFPIQCLQNKHFLLACNIKHVFQVDLDADLVLVL